MPSTRFCFSFFIILFTLFPAKRFAPSQPFSLKCSWGIHSNNNGTGVGWKKGERVRGFIAIHVHLVDDLELAKLQIALKVEWVWSLLSESLIRLISNANRSVRNSWQIYIFDQHFVHCFHLPECFIFCRKHNECVSGREQIDGEADSLSGWDVLSYWKEGMCFLSDTHERCNVSSLCAT